MPPFPWPIQWPPSFALQPALPTKRPNSHDRKNWVVVLHVGPRLREKVKPDEDPTDLSKTDILTCLPPPRSGQQHHANGPQQGGCLLLNEHAPTQQARGYQPVQRNKGHELV